MSAKEPLLPGAKHGSAETRIRMTVIFCALGLGIVLGAILGMVAFEVKGTKDVQDSTDAIFKTCLSHPQNGGMFAITAAPLGTTLHTPIPFNEVQGNDEQDGWSKDKHWYEIDDDGNYRISAAINIYFGNNTDIVTATFQRIRDKKTRVLANGIFTSATPGYQLRTMSYIDRFQEDDKIYLTIQGNTTSPALSSALAGGYECNSNLMMVYRLHRG